VCVCESGAGGGVDDVHTSKSRKYFKSISMWMDVIRRFPQALACGWILLRVVSDIFFLK